MCIMRAQWERSSSSTHCNRSTGWGGRSASRPGHFTPGKESPVYNEQKDGWTLEAGWTLRKRIKIYRRELKYMPLILL